jgi:hypothetical protein
VWTVPGGGQGPRQPGAPKSLRPSPGVGSPSPKPSASAGMPHASQCVKVPTGASGSSTTSASERASEGAPDQESAGERSWPSQVCLRGIRSPSANASVLSAKSATRGFQTAVRAFSMSSTPSTSFTPPKVV